MGYKDKLRFIFNEIRILTGLEPEIMCDDCNTVRFNNNDKSSRRVDLHNLNSTNDLVLFARLVSLDLTKPVVR